MSIAVVTGASSGMGAVFCHSLDAEGLDSIWIVARSAGRLEALSDELSTPCRVITADLSTSSGVDSLLSILDSRSLTYAISSIAPEQEDSATHGRSLSKRPVP